MLALNSFALYHRSQSPFDRGPFIARYKRLTGSKRRWCWFFAFLCSFLQSCGLTNEVDFFAEKSVFQDHTATTKANPMSKSCKRYACFCKSQTGRKEAALLKIRLSMKRV